MNHTFLAFLLDANFPAPVGQPPRLIFAMPVIAKGITKSSVELTIV